MNGKHVTVYRPAQPGLWSQLVRGGEIAGTAPLILGGITGFLLRSVLICCGCSVSAILLLALGQDRMWDVNLALFLVLAVWHSAVGLIVVFMRMKFRLLQILATIINIPVVMFLVRNQPDLDWTQYLLFAYLDLWLLFLLARWAPTYSFLAFLNDEIHYYLID